MSIAVWYCDFCNARSDEKDNDHYFFVSGKYAICEDCVFRAVKRVEELRKKKQVKTKERP